MPCGLHPAPGFVKGQVVVQSDGGPQVGEGCIERTPTVLNLACTDGRERVGGGEEETSLVAVIVEKSNSCRTPSGTACPIRQALLKWDFRANTAIWVWRLTNMYLKRTIQHLPGNGKQVDAGVVEQGTGGWYPCGRLLCDKKVHTKAGPGSSTPTASPGHTPGIRCSDTN